MDQEWHLIVDGVMDWARKEGRQPPWREVADQYALAVAEILLQKTKAVDVEPVWRRLMVMYPAAAFLARAKDADVQALVSVLGLGSQRTQRLKAMADTLASHGQLPQPLPGLGPYGAGIILLSLGQATPDVPVDGNIARVMCRYFGLEFQNGEPRKKPAVKAAVASLLDTQEEPSRKLQVIYGLVDLGEAICKPRRPVCSACPLTRRCRFAGEFAHLDL